MPTRVLFIQYTNPAIYPPLEHLSLLLADSGVEVLSLGSQADGEAGRFCLPTHPRIRVLLLRYQRPGLIQKLMYLYFCCWAVFKSITFGRSWIYASDALSTPAAWLLSLLPGRRVIYHEHDAPVHCPKGLVKRLIHAARKRVYHLAERVVVPSHGRRIDLSATLGERDGIDTVFNAPMLDEIREPSQSHSSETVLFYHGSLNLNRVPLAVVQALALLPPTVVFHYAGYLTEGCPTFHDDVLAEARRVGVEKRIRYLGAFPHRSDLLHTASNAHIGLAFMPNQSRDINMRTMAGASNKAFDYLACGLDLIVSDLPDWKELYTEQGIGRCCNPAEPESIAAAVQWFLNHPRERAEMKLRSHQFLLNEWNYPKQAYPILSWIARGAIPY